MGIRLLPEGLINRIAAGEVVERPASALKELVENALDAGASRIAVALDGGGVDRIDVVDDGGGMSAADLALAVQRHATSKLQDDHLVRISTLGFRGEALPAIGAVAKLEITSRQPGADHANCLRVEAGHVGIAEPCAGSAGTRVVVRDLFYATPARRKFLKNPRTEADHAETIMRRLALAAPAVAMRLELDGRLIFDLAATDREGRVRALLGEEVGAALLPVMLAREGVSLSGFVCAPHLHRATGVHQYLMVNGRPVADPLLKAAIRVAYREVIVPGRHAVVALFLELPVEDVDVNVHPAKTELRFRDANGMRGLLIGALSRALAAGAGQTIPAMHIGQPMQSYAGGHAIQRADRRAHAPHYTGWAEYQLPIGAPPASRQVEAPAPRGAEFPLGAPVAQVLDTYVIAVAADGSLVLVDQHAAHERLTHEALRAQYLEGAVATQNLLMPAVVDLPSADVARILGYAGQLAGLGMELEPFGPGAVLVRGLPAMLGASDPAPLLRDIADELAEMGETTQLQARLDALIARMACHGSIRAGRRMNATEMDALLRQMEATPRAATCSHGRPTFLKLSRAEIERLFGRR